ncbi:MAG: hypothetical protein ACRD2L_25605, partial [Terriglobia bacterium]
LVLSAANFNFAPESGRRAPRGDAWSRLTDKVAIRRLKASEAFSPLSSRSSVRATTVQEVDSVIHLNLKAYWY